ncbi:MAG: ice-binding family protein [bacterium]|nr:ice-binding family protein [bacterium]
MKAVNKISTVILAATLMFGLSVPTPALAAATPSLGAAATYGVLSSTYTNTTVTTINGDVGFTTPPAVAPLGTHPNYGSGASYSTAGLDQGTTLSALASQTCTFSFASGAIDLATDTTHGPIGVYTPGVYCVTGAMSVGTGGITLSGNGTYIFRSTGALNTVANSHVTLDGASSCDVFWTPIATTLGANSTFIGTVIDDAGITVGSTVTWLGRALAFGGTVTTDTNTITIPTCVVPPPPPPPCECTNQVIETMVSDLTTTVVGDSPAVIAVHPAWTASIPGSTWIWKSGATANNEVVAFEKNFTVVGTVLSAQLDIATDNSYEVFIDGVPVAGNVNDVNFTLATQDIYNLTANVTPGNHTLRIEVKNVGTYSVGSNPAGLLYKFEVKTCPDKCCGGSVTVTNNNVATVTNNENTQASTGSNSAGGSNAGNGGNGGSISGSGNGNNTGHGGRGGGGGTGGVVITGNANANSRVLNKVNTNITRVRR